MNGVVASGTMRRWLGGWDVSTLPKTQRTLEIVSKKFFKSRIQIAIVLINTREDEVAFDSQHGFL